MIIKSGVLSGSLTYGCTNLDFIASVSIESKKNYQSYKGLAGEHCLVLWYPDLDNREVIYVGSLDECIREQDEMMHSYAHGERVHSMAKALPMLDPEEFK